MIRYRNSGQHLLVFIHGLGCAADTWAGAWDADALADYSLLAFDLPGHGGTPGRGGMTSYAKYAEDRIHEHPDHEWFTVVAHSMGGAVALRMVPAVPLISVEGNLTISDCEAASLPVAAGEPFTPPRPDWARWWEQADPAALAQAARSLVSYCATSMLLDTFNSLPHKVYIHGAGTDTSHLDGKLNARSYTLFGTGHFPMLDVPETFYGLLPVLAGPPR